MIQHVYCTVSTQYTNSIFFHCMTARAESAQPALLKWTPKTQQWLYVFHWRCLFGMLMKIRQDILWHFVRIPANIQASQKTDLVTIKIAKSCIEHSLWQSTTVYNWPARAWFNLTGCSFNRWVFHSPVPLRPMLRSYPKYNIRHIC